MDMQRINGGLLRKSNSQDSKDSAFIIDQYLEKIDWVVNENSNMSYSLQGVHEYVCSAITK